MLAVATLPSRRHPMSVHGLPRGGGVVPAALFMYRRRARPEIPDGRRCRLIINRLFGFDVTSLKLAAAIILRDAVFKAETGRSCCI